MLEGSSLQFKPCYVKRTEIVHDLTGRLTKRLRKSDLPSVYAELSGERTSPGEPWVINKVHLLGGNQATCYHELSGNVLRAAGNKPLWIADIRDDGIYVKHFQRLSSLVFPLVEPVNTGNGQSWSSRLQGIEQHTLILNVTNDLCNDRYGVVYEFSAEMELNGRLYSGCARQGRLDERSLPGLYSAQLPSMKSTNHYITMDLTGSGDVRLTHDYRNNQSLLVKKGKWEELSKGKIIVMIEDDFSQAQEVLVFERDKRGRLSLKGFHAEYGRSGLIFERLGPEQSHRRFSP